MTTKPFRGLIRDWAIVYHAPYGYAVVGFHQTPGRGYILDANQYVRTSPIVSLNRVDELDHIRVETENSIYHLVGPCNDAEGRAAYSARTGR